LLAAATAASIVYLLDPKRGRSRRKAIRSQSAHAYHHFKQSMRGHARSVLDHAYGFLAENRAGISYDWPSDQLLVARARALMGHVIRHPHLVRVTADAGWIDLSGSVLPGEAQKLVRAVSRVNGVLGVDDHLDEHGWLYPHHA
jgi:hypothetical protein